MGFRSSSLHRIGRFSGDTSGVAAVEFALVLPLLLILYLGSIDAAQLYAVDRKLDTVAGTVADLVARAKGTLAQSQLDDYFDAATSIMLPNPTADLGQVVSLIFVEADGDAIVQWSEASGVGEARDEGDDFPLDEDTEMSQLARNASGYLVVGEASYVYVPVTGWVFPNSLALRHVEYFLPRREGDIDLD